MRERVVLALKGACMGFADAIPGVSGGTMALILGIYERFIAAISSLGPQTLSALLKAAFWRAYMDALLPGRTDAASATDPVVVQARHIAFLTNLVAGILAGIVVGILTLPVLMTRYPTAMRGFFFGLVLASIVVPYTLILIRAASLLIFFLLATGGTWALMGIDQSTSGSASTQVTLTTEDGQALSEDRTFEAAELHFATDTGQKKLKRELAFQPSSDTTPFICFGDINSSATAEAPRRAPRTTRSTSCSCAGDFEACPEGE